MSLFMGLVGMVSFAYVGIQLGCSVDTVLLAAAIVVAGGLAGIKD